MTIQRVRQLIDNDTAVLRESIIKLNWNPTKAQLAQTRRIAERIARFANQFNMPVDPIVEVYA